MKLEKSLLIYFVKELTLYSRDMEISDFKSKTADLQTRLNSETAKANEIELYYQDKLQQMRADIEVSFNTSLFDKVNDRELNII